MELKHKGEETLPNINSIIYSFMKYLLQENSAVTKLSIELSWVRGRVGVIDSNRQIYNIVSCRAKCYEEQADKERKNGKEILF